MAPQRALPTKTKVESGTSQRKSGTSVTSVLVNSVSKRGGVGCAAQRRAQARECKGVDVRGNVVDVPRTIIGLSSQRVQHLKSAVP